MWKEKHLKVQVKQNGRTLLLKAWNFAERLCEMPAGSRVDIAFQLEEDAYSASRGYPGWCAILRDVRAAAHAVGAALQQMQIREGALLSDELLQRAREWRKRSIVVSTFT